MIAYTGEGSKRAFLAIAELIQIMEQSSESASRQELVTMLSKAQDVLGSYEDYEMKRKGDKNEAIETMKRSAHLTIRRSLVSRVPRAIGTHLSDLLCQFLDLNLEGCTSGESFLNNMDLLISSFPALVVEVYNKSIYESGIGEGSFIHSNLSVTSQKLNFSKHKAAKNIKFVIISAEKPD